MKRHCLDWTALVLLAGGCALSSEAGTMPSCERDRLEREYAKCFHEQEVLALRDSYVSRFPEQEAIHRGMQFDAWRESEIARIFGPKPEARGSCERHGLPLEAGIAPTTCGRRTMATGGLRVFDLDDPDSWHDPHAPPQPLHPRVGADLGCQMVSAFSWAIYCAACEAERPAWLAYTRQ